MKNTITSDEILGKDVVNKAGAIIGVVQQLHLDRERMDIVGITIDQGFMKPDLFVGVDNIENFGVDSVFLNIVPSQNFVGLMVFENSGKLVGKVSKVELARSRVKKLIVKDKLRKKEIPASKIKKIEGNVILK